jgi:glycerol-3-phosphate dehydrogenase
LEHGEFDLVRESLAERSRLARLAPHLVRPLRLFIPVSNRWRGWARAAARFLRRERGGRAGAQPAPRGLLLIRYGLWLYDRFARSPLFPRPRVLRTGGARGKGCDAPPVAAERYPWVVSFYDAQVMFPERLTVALLHDARRLAAERGARFDLYTYAGARREGNRFEILDRLRDDAKIAECEPAAIVNATGAWVDDALRQLRQASPRLMRGTKGSHVVLASERLRAALGNDGVYAEAVDGRPVFLLPFGPWSLVGTTDEPYEGDPSAAVATPAEIDYLLHAANEIFPDVNAGRSDVMLHYAGVRPLPNVPAGSTAAVTRRHWVEEHAGAEPPLFSLIGGKLTTCRSLAQDAAARVRIRLGQPPAADSRERLIPGGEDHPPDLVSLEALLTQLARSSGHEVDALRSVWRLCGGLTRDFLASSEARDRTLLAGGTLPIGFVRWIVAREWVRRLDDLIERRLMLLYDRTLTRPCLEQLAQVLVEAGACEPERAERAVSAAIARLAAHFGRLVTP